MAVIGYVVIEHQADHPPKVYDYDIVDRGDAETLAQAANGVSAMHTYTAVVTDAGQLQTVEPSGG